MCDEAKIQTYSLEALFLYCLFRCRLDKKIETAAQGYLGGSSLAFLPDLFPRNMASQLMDIHKLQVKP